MTPATLSAHLKSLGLSAGGFARLIGVSKRTVERYLSGSVAIPGPVERIALLLATRPHDGLGSVCREILAELTAIGQASGDYEGPKNKSPTSDKMS